MDRVALNKMKKSELIDYILNLKNDNTPLTTVFFIDSHNNSSFGDPKYGGELFTKAKVFVTVMNKFLNYKVVFYTPSGYINGNLDVIQVEAKLPDYILKDFDKKGFKETIREYLIIPKLIWGQHYKKDYGNLKLTHMETELC